MNEAEISKMSAGPYQWAVVEAGPEQWKWITEHFAHGSGDVHMVYLPKHEGTIVGDGGDPMRPEHGVTLCMTGNGPNSKNNALALCCLLNQRELAIKAKQAPLPIPTTPEAVAWSQYAIELEGYLGIADEVPARLKNLSVEQIINPGAPQ